MSYNAVAFYIGLFGSIHCIGMCGPLAFAMPAAGKGSSWWLLLDKLIYQLGRITSYTVLGLIIGIVGKQIWLLGFQQGLSLISGLLIILAAIASWLKLSFFRSGKAGKTFQAVNRLIGYALQHHWGHYAIGLLNGLLPCGFVYIALLGAVNTHNIISAGWYMVYFGLGTLPLMYLAAIGSGFISLQLRRKLNRAIPYVMVCLGFWFILRGLSLNVPYLSPSINAGPATCR